MKIDEIAFTPWYYGIENGTSKLNVSQDECDFFGCSHPSVVPVGSPAYDYFYKLGVYINRFGNPMPVEIRKDFLRELKIIEKITT